MMADASLGEPYARYAAVARLMMDTFSSKCLDARFSTYLKDMTNTSWEGPAAGGGVSVSVCVLGSGAFVYMWAWERETAVIWPISILKCSFNNGYFSVLGNFLVHSV